MLDVGFDSFCPLESANGCVGYTNPNIQAAPHDDLFFPHSVVIRLHDAANHHELR